MSRKQDRIDLSLQIKYVAVLYKQHLVGRKFMYIFDNRYIEVIFKKENFRHLTGIDTRFLKIGDLLPWQMKITFGKLIFNNQF